MSTGPIYPPNPDPEQVWAALVKANSLLRSAHSIATRQGAATNWEPFTARIYEALQEQHRLMYPEQYVDAATSTYSPIYPPDPDLPGPPIPPPVTPPVTVAQCLVCFHRSETTCDMCGGTLGTATLPPCKACPNGLVIA